MSSTMTDELQTLDSEAINALLRSELAAVEVYTQVMGLFVNDVVIDELQRIRTEHRRAVRRLRDHLVELGVKPVDECGSWGTFSHGAVGAASLGPATVLAMLRQGEERGITAYEGIMESSELYPHCLRIIQAELIPACRRHVEELNSLLGGANR